MMVILQENGIKETIIKSQKRDSTLRLLYKSIVNQQLAADLELQQFRPSFKLLKIVDGTIVKVRG